MKAEDWSPLSPRTKRALILATGVSTATDLAARAAAEPLARWLTEPGVGYRALAQIRVFVAKHGLTFPDAKPDEQKTANLLRSYRRLTTAPAYREALAVSLLNGTPAEQLIDEMARRVPTSRDKAGVFLHALAIASGALGKRTDKAAKDFEHWVAEMQADGP